MARPRADLPDTAALAAFVMDGRLSVRVTPGARSEGITIEDDRVLVKVRARPQDGAANEAVCRLVAQGLGISASSVRVSRGATSREKMLQVDG